MSSYSSSCTSLGCTIDPSDGLCKCPVEVQNSIAFENESQISVEGILATATFGALPPTMSGENIAGDNSIKKYPSGALTADTVFEFNDGNGQTKYRKNLLSKVVLGNGGLQIRNPVTFHTLSEYTERDAAYELDAALEQFFYHPNTGTLN